MALAGWVRDRLWGANNWSAELTAIRQDLATERRSATTLERMFDVASATEYCDPDRGRALTLYLDAWRGGHAGAGERARHLARSLGAHMALAEIAMAGGDLVAAGTAFVDAGFPDLAVEPLERFVKTRPPGASPVTENVRIEGVTALLGIARGKRLDAEREIAESLARARHATGQAAAAAYVHAARIARTAHLGDRFAAVLVAATHACPDDDSIAALVEARLFETSNTDELLAHYSARLEVTTSRADYVERARAAGVELIARNLQPGLGLRLLRMSLEHAYKALLPDITSHIAAWELLWTHAQVQHSTLDLAPLLVQALAAPLPEDDALYLARLGLEIAWHHASDPIAARPYAQMVLDFVPEHPLAIAFVKEAAPELAAEAAPEAAPDAVSVALPPAAVSVVFVTPAPTRATSRIPVLEGQVKRAEPAPSAAKHSHRPSGRMALLKPVPGNEGRLGQDGFPIPTAPQPSRAPTYPPRALPIPTAPPPSRAPTYPPRALRKVVPVDVVVELSGGGFFSTVLRDVSTSGAFLVTKRKLEVGTVVSLEMRVPIPGAVTQSSHRTNARIVRLTDIGFGLAFLDASPQLIAAIEAISE